MNKIIKNCMSELNEDREREFKSKVKESLRIIAELTTRLKEEKTRLKAMELTELDFSEVN